MDYCITYRNYGKPEQTPKMKVVEAHIQHNVKLLKIQGATSVRVHRDLS